MFYSVFLIQIWIFWILAFLNHIFIKNIFPKTKKYKLFPFFIMFFLQLLFFISFIFSRVFDLQIFSFFYKIWAFAVWASFLSLLVLSPFYIILKIYRKDFNKYLQILVIFSLFFINILWIFNAYSYKIVNHEIKTEKNTALKWKKFILIADTHYWNIFWKSQAERLVKKLNSIDADWIFIAWDFFDWPSINFFEIWEIFKKINKPIFFAPWNHEEYWNIQAMLNSLSNNKNLFLLLNENKKFLDANISWVTFSVNKRKIFFEETLKHLAVNKENFNILIKHEPKFASLAFENNYDLVVFWHSHKWQMWPFSYIVKNIYWKYFYWLNEENWKYSITTSWVWGWWPQRFWSRSEIVVIKII